MTGVGGVGGLAFRPPVMVLVGTGFVARSEVVEAREFGRAEEGEESDVASDVCPPKHIGEVLSSPEPVKPDSAPRPFQSSFVKAPKRAADSSALSIPWQGYS